MTTCVSRSQVPVGQILAEISGLTRVARNEVRRFQEGEQRGFWANIGLGQEEKQRQKQGWREG